MRIVLVLVLVLDLVLDCFAEDRTLNIEQRTLNIEVSDSVAPQTIGAQMGRRLFQVNCAHCHGDDARGDEGPSLYNLTLSDSRIAKRIREGIKGEMPRFGGKFSDDEIQALISYLRTLKEETRSNEEHH